MQRRHQSHDGHSFSAADKVDDLSPVQRKEVKEQSRPDALLLHEVIRAEGESELDRATHALALSGLAAGLSMGFSLVAQGVLRASLPAGPARELIAPFGYAIGFLIVILGRQQLFTENTLTPILPLLHHRDAVTARNVLRLWTVVLLSNTVGTIAFGFAIAHSGIFERAVTAAFADLGRETIQNGFGATFVKAIFAGWLIALLVWLLPGVQAARLWVIIIITALITLGHFSHVVAGSVDCAYLVAIGQAGWGDFFARFYVPTLLGNIVGGVALVAVLNYGQVAHEMK